MQDRRGPSPEPGHAGSLVSELQTPEEHDADFCWVGHPVMHHVVRAARAKTERKIIYAST